MSTKGKVPQETRNGSKILKLGLPKGRFEQLSREVVEYLGGSWDPGLLRVSAGGARCEVYLLKCPDIVDMVEAGYLDIGLTPDEWFYESRARLGSACGSFRVLDVCLPTRLSLFAAGKTWPPRDQTGRIKIVTPYPALLRQTLGREFPANRLELISVVGSSEALVGSVADYGFDCIESGSTLRRHHLEEVWVTHPRLGVTGVHRPVHQRGHRALMAKLQRFARSRRSNDARETCPG